MCSLSLKGMEVDIGVIFWGEHSTTTAFEQLLSLLLIDVD